MEKYTKWGNFNTDQILDSIKKKIPLTFQIPIEMLNNKMVQYWGFLSKQCRQGTVRWGYGGNKTGWEWQGHQLPRWSQWPPPLSIHALVWSSPTVNRVDLCSHKTLWKWRRLTAKDRSHTSSALLSLKVTHFGRSQQAHHKDPWIRRPANGWH